MNVTVARDGVRSVLRVEGDMDVNSAYDVYRSAVTEAEQGFSVVTIDLAAVSFLDSVGLGMLVRVRDELPRSYESQLVLRNPSPQVQRLLELTALTSEFDVSD